MTYRFEMYPYDTIIFNLELTNLTSAEYHPKRKKLKGYQKKK